MLPRNLTNDVGNEAQQEGGGSAPRLPLNPFATPLRAAGRKALSLGNWRRTNDSSAKQGLLGGVFEGNEGASADDLEATVRDIYTEGKGPPPLLRFSSTSSTGSVDEWGVPIHKQQSVKSLHGQHSLANTNSLIQHSSIKSDVDRGGLGPRNNSTGAIGMKRQPSWQNNPSRQLFSQRSWFNPEVFTQQKREWVKQFDDKNKIVEWPQRCFEQFVIVGLSPTTDVKSVVSDVLTAQRAKSDGEDVDVTTEAGLNAEHRGTRGEAMNPEILYAYPPERPTHGEVPAFCFPHGVQPTLLERTPSMSALNELVYSQDYQTDNSSSFVFLLKAAGSLPMYGVCCYMQELVHRPPSILSSIYPHSRLPISKYLVAAPRCYCILSQYPFFTLHMKVLHTVMGLERLDRISGFVDEVEALLSGTSPGALRRLNLARDGSDMSSRHTESPIWGDEDTQRSAEFPQPSETDEEAPSVEHGLEEQRSGLTDRTMGSAASAEDDGNTAMFGSEIGAGEGSADGNGAVSSESDGDAAMFGGMGGDAAAPSLQHSSDSGGSSEADVGGHLATAHVPGSEEPSSSYDELSDMMRQQQLDCSDTAGSRSQPSGNFASFGYEDLTAALKRTGIARGGRQTSGSSTKSRGSISGGLGTVIEEGGSGDHALRINAAAARLAGSRRASDVASRLSETEADPETAGRAASEAGEFATPPGAGTAGAPEDWAPPGPLRTSGSGEGFRSAPQGLEGARSRSFSAGPKPSPADALRRASARIRASASLRSTPSVDIAADAAVASTSQEAGLDPADMSHRRSFSAAAAGNGHDSAQAGPFGDHAGAVVALKFVQSFYHSRVPEPGQDFVFRPEPGLQALTYYRPRIQALLESESLESVAIRAAEAEAAEALAAWTVAATCKALSLNNILLILTAVLLEQQMVVFCPNIGALSSVVLSLVPLMRPFSWQSLLLPVLPAQDPYLDILDAPVPFIVGCQYKTADVRSRCSPLLRVNVYKNQVKNASGLPELPRVEELAEKLEPYYNVLNARRSSGAGKPLYDINQGQRSAAEGFLRETHKYLQGLLADLDKHTITDVQTSERVSLLLKDSFVESFPPTERPFIRQFVESQMFTEYTDSVLA